MSLFVGRLPTSNFDDRDLEDIFYKYGKIIKCQLKRGSRFGKIEISFQLM
jgi:RNA recognition motif-containing protein